MKITGSASAISTSDLSDRARQQLRLALSRIPHGRLCSYGELARQAGLPGRARWVGRQLSQLPKETALPWHRVVNAQGRISFPVGSDQYQRQLQRLLEEGSADTTGKLYWRQRRWPLHED